jgi:hypothetical protein
MFTTPTYYKICKTGIAEILADKQLYTKVQVLREAQLVVLLIIFSFCMLHNKEVTMPTSNRTSQ